MKKDWWKSRMIWINVLVTVSGIATALADHLTAGGALTGIGVVNIVLRVLTKQPVK